MADGAMEQTILTAISAVGFPIVVTFYLLTDSNGLWII